MNVGRVFMKNMDQTWLRVSICLTGMVLVLGSAVIVFKQGPVTRADLPLTVPSEAACSTRYELMASPVPSDDLTIDKRIRNGFGATRRWGVKENVDIRSEPANAHDQSVIRVRFPAGSSSPGDAERAGVARGGAGFYASPVQLVGAERVCLSYQLRFPKDFDFVKGGKLPGLYGGDAPSGGTPATGKNGFSMRFMWREDGQGELYEYVVSNSDYPGVSIGRGLWHFPTDKWLNLELEVVLNTPGNADGIARVWVDGNPILEQLGVVFRSSETVTIEGLMFSTFFGGQGKGWRTPHDQIIDFTDFRLYAQMP